MTRIRDDFNQRTKNDLALRAGYLCSYCKRSTVGPSDERPDAVAMIGIAAHICAAAPGPGARRYDPNMTPEERSHIDNGIWLCASCSVLIDRDQERFSVEVLRQMRRDHEASCRLGDNGSEAEGDLVAIGSDIVAVGHILGSGPAGMRVRLSHFVEGASRDLLALVHEFDRQLPEKRYILMNELGYGGLLDGAPNVERMGSAYEVQFRLQQTAPRRDATAEAVGMCAETGRMISGMDAYIQNFERALGMARGTWFARIRDGSDLSDLYWRYKDSPWFKRLAMMEMIRLSSIPSIKKCAHGPSTPFACVNRVNRVEVPTFELEGQRLNLRVEFDIEGLGPWSGELSVFISTPEQLAKGRASARIHHENIQRIEAESRNDLL
ncbi:hypothetical protein GGR34_001525 [Microvirga flocculans]|uniref:HNH endonuclease n=1 Tax=Microvirga flocculans TaxID=217168 RepID=A0A7W6IEA6_9HYPH|nr:HNH endonuclease [Microvirga flocculans]MBB4039878.1 hypothetical protein [Microvirga flocculans]